MRTTRWPAILSRPEIAHRQRYRKRDRRRLNIRRGTRQWQRNSKANGQTIADPFDISLSSPIVANGVVYFGSGDSNLYALNSATGDLSWKFKTGDVVHASPALADGVLFFGSWDSDFYAVDAATGK